MFWAFAPLVVAVSAVATDRVRGRFAGGFVESTEVTAFLCLVVEDCMPDSSASSPDASREDGWSKSAVEELFSMAAVSAFLLRFADPEDDGEDIVHQWQQGVASKSLDNDIRAREVMQY